MSGLTVWIRSGLSTFRAPLVARSTLVMAVVLSLVGCGGAQRPWNVVLFTFDTTRADALGCYGNAGASTPHLDRLAGDGVLFSNAMASNPVTQAAHSTILTGTWPMVHGVRDNLLFRLPEERATLAELLRARGYDTGAAVGGFPLVRSFGSDQGFDFYDDDLTAARLDHRGQPVGRRSRTWYDERPAGHVNDAILPWLRERLGGERPFFAWLHYWDPHEPLIAPEPFGQLFAHDPYLGEVAYADRSLGALLDVLDRAGELERTLVVMVSDHGEGHMDHGEATHAFLAYGSTLHVPLIVRVPEVRGSSSRSSPPPAGERIAARVGTVDIVPTVLDLLGFDIPADIQGRSLAPLMYGETRTPEPSTYYSESLSPRLSHGVGELRVLYRGPYKYIHGPRPELYDLEADPGEIHDLVEQMPAERNRLERELQMFIDEHSSAEASAAVHEVDRETRQKLEALGYLSSTGDERPEVTEILSADGAVPQDRVGDINLMGRLRRELGAGQFHLAKMTAVELLRGDPHNAYYQGRLATALLAMEQVSEAAALVDGATTVSAANRDQFLAVARGLFSSGEKDRATVMAARLVAAVEDPEGRLVLARMHDEKGDTEEFERNLERALELEPTHLGARLRKAEFLEKTDRAGEAEALYRDLVTEFPVDVRAHFGYARLLGDLSRSEEALPRLERVIRLAPGYCEARLEYLRVLVDLERHEEAVSAARELEEVCRGEDIRQEAAKVVSQ